MTFIIEISMKMMKDTITFSELIRVGIRIHKTREQKYELLCTAVDIYVAMIFWEQILTDSKNKAQKSVFHPDASLDEITSR